MSISLLIWFAMLILSQILCMENLTVNYQNLHQIYDQNNIHTRIENSNIIHFNSIQLMLLNHDIQPSRSLCEQYGLIKCGKICCQKQKHFYSYRTHQNSHKSSQEQTKQLDLYLIRKKLCEKQGKQMCGDVCCKNNYCEIDQNNYNIRVKKSWCNQNISSLQAQCKKYGLLWCDGECCGFNSHKHKCFKTNHYGASYIRCPIQDPVK